jgi:hypothetical protein
MSQNRQTSGMVPVDQMTGRNLRGVIANGTRMKTLALDASSDEGVIALQERCRGIALAAAGRCQQEVDRRG